MDAERMIRDHNISTYQLSRKLGVQKNIQEEEKTKHQCTCIYSDKNDNIKHRMNQQPMFIDSHAITFFGETKPSTHTNLTSTQTRIIVLESPCFNFSTIIENNNNNHNNNNDNNTHQKKKKKKTTITTTIV